MNLDTKFLISNANVLLKADNNLPETNKTDSEDEELEPAKMSALDLSANYNMAVLNKDKNIGEILAANKPMKPEHKYKISDKACFILAPWSYKPEFINLDTKEMKNLLLELAPGESFTFGRKEGENSNPEISEDHLTIGRDDDGSLYAIDNNSKNGTHIMKNTIMPEYGACDFEFKKMKHYTIPFKSNLILGQTPFKLTDFRDKISAMKDGESLNVGSAEGADIKLDGAGVLPSHLTLTRCGRTLVMTNLGEACDTKFDGFDLDFYKPAPNVKITTPVQHSMWRIKNAAAFKDRYGAMPDSSGVWTNYNSKTGVHNAWKMHIYSDNENDWRTMFTLIAPYLKDSNVVWKTLGALMTPEKLDLNGQSGKAFTIYPKNNEEMAKIAKDLDYLFRANGLTKEGNSINGDRQMGTSGRIFYRYEYNSGSVKDEIVDVSTKEGVDRYNSLYRPADNNYLAPDMSEEDDSWLNFDPSDKNSVPRG